MGASVDVAVDDVRLVRRPPILLRWMFLTVLAVWVCFGIVNATGQDAVPYMAAAHVARSHPGDVYPVGDNEASRVSARFRTAGCADAPVEVDCDSWVLAYVSSPQMLTPAVILERLSGRFAVRVMNVGSALLLAAGMLLLWRRLADRHRRAPLLLVVSAVFMSPLALFAIFMGQTSPVMFLSVCLGIAVERRRGRIVSGAVWAVASMLKLFPALLGLLLLARRRRTVLMAGIGTAVGFTLASAVLLPTSIWGHFVRNMTRWDGSADPQHTGASLSTNLLRLLGESPASHLVAVVLPFGVAAVFAWLGLRKGGDDDRWAVGYVALLLVAPVVWNHYLLVLVGAVGVVLSGRSRPGREIYALPAVSFLVSIPMLLNNTVAVATQITSQSICLLIGAVTVLWLVNLDREPSLEREVAR